MKRPTGRLCDSGRRWAVREARRRRDVPPVAWRGRGSRPAEWPGGVEYLQGLRGGGNYGMRHRFSARPVEVDGLAECGPLGSQPWRAADGASDWVAVGRQRGSDCGVIPVTLWGRRVR